MGNSLLFSSLFSSTSATKREEQLHCTHLHPSLWAQSIPNEVYDDEYDVSRCRICNPHGQKTCIWVSTYLRRGRSLVRNHHIWPCPIAPGTHILVTLVSSLPSGPVAASATSCTTNRMSEPTDGRRSQQREYTYPTRAGTGTSTGSVMIPRPLTAGTALVALARGPICSRRRPAPCQ